MTDAYWGTAVQAICTIVIFCASVSSAVASTDSPVGVAREQMVSRPNVSGPDPLENQLENQVERLRIQLRVTPYAKVPTKTPDGTAEHPSYMSGKTLTHILRARVDKPNQFYIGDWHVDTTPVRWLKRTNRYQTRLEIYRRYGEFGQLEESLGTFTVTGMLKKQADGLYVFYGFAQKRFRDREGHPVVDIAAGQREDKEPSSPVAKGSGGAIQTR